MLALDEAFGPEKRRSAKDTIFVILALLCTRENDRLV